MGCLEVEVAAQRMQLHSLYVAPDIAGSHVVEKLYQQALHRLSLQLGRRVHLHSVTQLSVGRRLRDIVFRVGGTYITPVWVQHHGPNCSAHFGDAGNVCEVGVFSLRVNQQQQAYPARKQAGAVWH